MTSKRAIYRGPHAVSYYAFNIFIEYEMCLAKTGPSCHATACFLVTNMAHFLILALVKSLEIVDREEHGRGQRQPEFEAYLILRLRW